MIESCSENEIKCLERLFQRRILINDLDGIIPISRVLVAACIEDMLISGWESATTRDIQDHMFKLEYHPDWDRVKDYKVFSPFYSNHGQLYALKTVIRKINDWSDRAIRHIKHHHIEVKNRAPHKYDLGEITWDLTTYRGLKL